MGFRRIQFRAQAPYIVLLMAVGVSASELHSLPIMTSFHVFKIALNIYNKPNPNEKLIGIIIEQQLTRKVLQQVFLLGY